MARGKGDANWSQSEIESLIRYVDQNHEDNKVNWRHYKGPRSKKQAKDKIITMKKSLGVDTLEDLLELLDSMLDDDFESETEADDAGPRGGEKGHRKGYTGNGEAKVKFYKADWMGRMVAEGGEKVPEGESWEFYVFPKMESLNWESFRVHRTLVSLMYRFYSNAGAKQSIDQMCNILNWPRTVFYEVRARLGLTHTKAGLSDEALEEMSYEEIIQDAEKTAQSGALLWLMKHQDAKSAEERRELLRLRKERVEWTLTEEKVIEELQRVAPDFNRPLSDVPEPDYRGDDQRVDVMNFFDWHVGEAFSAEAAVSTPFNVNVLALRLDNVIAQWRAFAGADPVRECHIVFGGDQMHTIDGFTAHGTDLRGAVGTPGSDQLLICGDLIEKVIKAGLHSYERIVIRGIRGGNHDANEKKNHNWLHTVLEFLRKRFESDRVSFETTKAATMHFQLGRNDILLDHGYKLPDVTRRSRPTKPQDKLVPAERLVSIFNLDGFRSYILRGDIHKRMFNEEAGVEEVCCGSLVGGNPYAETIFRASRSAQTLTRFDLERGLTGLEFFYGED